MSFLVMISLQITEFREDTCLEEFSSFRLKYICIGSPDHLSQYIFGNCSECLKKLASFYYKILRNLGLKTQEIIVIFTVCQLLLRVPYTFSVTREWAFFLCVKREWRFIFFRDSWIYIFPSWGHWFSIFSWSVKYALTYAWFVNQRVLRG